MPQTTSATNDWTAPCSQNEALQQRNLTCNSYSYTFMYMCIHLLLLIQLRVEAGACLSTRGSVHPHQSVTGLTQRNRQPFTLIFKLTANWDSPISPHVTSVSACLHDSNPKPSYCEATVRYMLCVCVCIYNHFAYTYNSIIHRTFVALLWTRQHIFIHIYTVWRC